MTAQNINLYRTQEGIASYPHIFKKYGDPGKEKFQVQILMTPEDFNKPDKVSGMSIKQWVEHHCKEKFGVKADGKIAYPYAFQKPYKKGEDCRIKKGENAGQIKTGYEGKIAVKCISGDPIQVFDANRNPVTDETKIYGGVHVKAVVSPYIYPAKAGDPGICLILKGLQIVGDGPLLGGGEKVDTTDIFEDETATAAKYGATGTMFDEQDDDDEL